MAQRILLVDDHRLVRAGIRALLEKMPNVQVVAEGKNGRQAFELVDRHRPDIVLLDIAMPNLNGLDAVDRIKRDWPDTKVIVLSMHANEEYVLRALRSDVSPKFLRHARSDRAARSWSP